MASKRTIAGVGVAVLFLAAGCGATHMDRKRDEADQRWAVSRAEMSTRMAQACYERGEYGRARQHVDEVIKTGATYAPLYILAAKLAAEKRDLDGARTFAESARAIQPMSPEARYVLGTIEQALGHPERAQIEYSEAARLDPKEPRYALAKTEMMVTRGEAEAAAKYLTEAAVEMPGRAEVHTALGDVLTVLGRHREAVGSYRMAMRLEPKQEGLRTRLATALFHSGAFAEAEPMLAELCASEPNFASGWAFLMRAECFLAMGRVAEARAVCGGVGDARKTSVPARVVMAKCDILENRLDSAQKHLEAALALEPQHSEVNAMMGYVLVAAGRQDEARTHLRLALQDADCAGRDTVERLLAMAEAGAKLP